jgi:hypothetical protein
MRSGMRGCASGTVAMLTLACLLMASPASARCRGDGARGDGSGGTGASAIHCGPASANSAVQSGLTDFAAARSRGWNGGPRRGCHRHWVGMADYYGVPWAYSDFFDGDTACADGGWGDEAAPQTAYVPGDPSYCARTYHSYDPASGTYLGHDGLRHPCR